MDFLAPEEGLPFALTPVRDGQYPFGEGLSWAEPSIVEMACRMRNVRRAREREATSVASRLALRHSEVGTVVQPACNRQGVRQTTAPNRTPGAPSERDLLSKCCPPVARGLVRTHSVDQADCSSEGNRKFGSSSNFGVAKAR